jgi:hypothetical protein
LIVDAFEQTKAADTGPVKRIIPRIVAGHDPSDDLAISPRRKQFGVTVKIKRMFLPIEKRSAFNDQWRDPNRIISIDAPRKFDEIIALASRTGLRDLDR